MMPGCCVPKCNNRSEKGYRLFRVPQGERNSEWRKVWLHFIKRTDVTARTCICEAHFDENQFETKRADGRKLLKKNAVPTLSHAIAQKHAGSPEMSLPHAQEAMVCEDRKAIERKDEEFVSNMQFEHVKSQLKALQKENSCLKKENNLLREKYAKIFNEDQICSLQHGNHKGVEWSDTTISKGLRLYMACGAKGYEELQRQHIPLPSIRTLQHRIRGIKFEPGVLEDVFNLLELKVSWMLHRSKIINYSCY